MLPGEGYCQRFARDVIPFTKLFFLSFECFQKILFGECLYYERVGIFFVCFVFEALFLISQSVMGSMK